MSKLYPQVSECQPRVECPARPKDMYVEIAKADCEKINTFIIPHAFVRNIGEARAFPNHFAVIDETNQTVHIDSYGNTLPLSNAQVFRNSFNPAEKEGIYKNTMVFDFVEGKGYIYNPVGQYASWNITVMPNPVLDGGE